MEVQEETHEGVKRNFPWNYNNNSGPFSIDSKTTYETNLTFSSSNLRMPLSIPRLGFIKACSNVTCSIEKEKKLYEISYTHLYW